MNQLDVAGTLQTYALKASNASSKEQLQDIIKELKQEFDARTINKFRVIEKNW